MQISKLSCKLSCKFFKLEKYIFTIHGFGHNFYNWKVRLTDTLICIARKLFGFDFCLLLKRIRLSVCIGGSNVTKINYANFGNKVNYINTLKHYLKAQIDREGKNSSGKSHGTISVETDILKFRGKIWMNRL